jgi:hypothetical protein
MSERMTCLVIFAVSRIITAIGFFAPRPAVNKTVLAFFPTFLKLPNITEVAGN